MGKVRPLLLTAVTLVLIMGLALPGLAAKNCWGVVTSQRAVAVHDIGEHSSATNPERTQPRLGLGNVARAVLGEGAHVSDLGSVLASLDGIEATDCE